MDDKLGRPDDKMQGAVRKGVRETDDNGNAMFQSYLFQTIQKSSRLKIRSYRRSGEHGKKTFVFLGLFVHVPVRGGTCAFTLNIVNTLIKNSSRDDRPSIST